MLDQTNANIERHIKTHTERSDDDRSAVSVLETFLRSNGRINTSFASDDKWPNHDNTFEFVPNPDISRRPKQTFYVQIKGTRNYTKREGVIKYTLKDLAFPAFICDRVSLDPGILFVILNPAERGNERVFWKYMSPNFLNSIDFAKGSMTVSFSPEEEILNDDESVLAFCERLEEIVERHSCVNQLERHSYSFEEAKRIVEACDEEITESIDNLSMNDREVNPEKYIAPKNWYKYGGEIVRPYKIRIQPPCAKDEKKLRRYYESKLAALPDVMDVAAAVDFTGYNRRTVCQWIRVGKLKALSLLQKYMIPKCYLIDWLCSDDYNNTNRKSRRHIDMLWEAQKWRD